DLRRRLKKKVAGLRMGDPREEKTFIGPVIDEPAAERIESWVDAAIKGGAKRIAGGPRKGNMVPATLMEKVPFDSDLYRQEVFGPVACLQPFDDFSQALDIVNAGDFGLQTGVFTASLAHTMRAWDELEVGGVIVGDIPSFRVDNMPYGGVKQSGLGREGVGEAVEDMAERLLLVVRCCEAFLPVFFGPHPHRSWERSGPGRCGGRAVRRIRTSRSGAVPAARVPAPPGSPGARPARAARPAPAAPRRRPRSPRSPRTARARASRPSRRPGGR